MKARVEGNPSLIRDLNNGAILNTDSVTIKKAKEAKAVRNKNKEELIEIKNDVSELKLMLQQILEKL
jgi:hypothetical protein